MLKKEFMILSMKNIIGKLLLCISLVGIGIPVVAQSAQSPLAVSGKITDAATGKPVTNAEIKVPGYSNAIVNEDGSFKLNVPSLRSTVVFTAQGYNTKEVSLCGATSLKVALINENAPTAFQSLLLPEGDVTKNTYSHAIEQKDNFAVYTGTSLEELLQREFGSLRVNVRSGQPGIGANIYLRGYNSLNGASQPLIIVDGMIFDQNIFSSSVHSGYYSNPLSDIDPNDIERISVLKEGSLMYGVKGANGVIIIETKRAAALSTKVNAILSAGINLAPKSIPMMGASDYRVYAIEQATSKGLNASAINAQDYMNDNTQYANYYRYHNNTNWQDEVFKNSYNKNAFLTVSGGDDIAKYTLSLGFANYQGVISNTDLNRLNTRFNADVNITRKLSFSANLGFSTIDGNIKDDGINATTGIRYLALTKSPLVAPFLRARYTGETSTNYEDVDFWGKSNPVYLENTEKYVGTSAQYRMAFSGKLKYEISKALNVSSLVGVVVDDNKEQYAAPDFGVANYVLEKGYGYQKQQKQINRLQQFYNETRIDLNKTLNNYHNITANAGFRLQNSVNEFDYISGYNSGDDSYTSMTSSLSFKNANGYKNEYRYLSMFLNAGYNYQKKYFINATIASDATSRYGKNAAGGFKIGGYPFAVLPGVSGSWNVSSENFMKSLKFIDLFKVRAAYAVAANDVFADNIAKSYYTSNMYVSNGSGVVFTNLGNSGLKWETIKKKNIGADLSLFNELLLLSVDYFNNNTTDLIVRKTNSFSGLSGYYANDGAMNNTGFDVSAQVRVVNTADWMWNVGVSASHYVNKVTSISDDVFTSAYGGTVLTRAGLPVGVFYGYKTNGVYSTTAEALADGYSAKLANGSLIGFRAGDVRFVDLNDDKVIDSKDMQVIGDPNPDVTGNLHSGLSYKNFTLSTLR